MITITIPKVAAIILITLWCIEIIMRMLLRILEHIEMKAEDYEIWTKTQNTRKE